VGEDVKWPRARLIPVSGISSQKEAETRAASAVLAVLSIVRDLSIELFSPMGASRAQKAVVETFTEPQFTVDGKKVRPDGVIRVTFGKSVWTALVEVKTGDCLLEADQINTYWDLARTHGFDAVVTISNEIAPSADSHPTAGLKVRANSKVPVHHISWTALLAAAVTVKVHRGVSDPEQAWILAELVRYLEHPASGAMAFDDMGPNWTEVRDAARDGGLRRTDESVRDVAQRWDQLLRFAALQLGARIGQDVQQHVPRKQDPKARHQSLVDALCSGAPLDGTLRIPNTVGDLEISANLKSRRLTASVGITAPEDRGGKARCSWLLTQLKGAPPGLVIDAYPKNARVPTTATLAQVIDNKDLLLGPDKRDPFRFVLSLPVEMGMGRKTGSRSPGFIDSVTNLIENFYGTVVQDLTPWTPKASRIATRAPEPDREDAEEPATDSMEQPSPFRFPTAPPSYGATASTSPYSSSLQAAGDNQPSASDSPETE
jgi:hypothetical protein